MSEVVRIAADVVRGRRPTRELAELLRGAGVGHRTVKKLVKKARECRKRYEEGDSFAPAMYASLVLGVVDAYAGVERDPREAADLVLRTVGEPD